MPKVQGMPIPLLDLKAQLATIRDEVREAIDRVVESQQFILGPEVEGAEHEVAEYSQCAYGVGVSSGTDALLAAMMVLDIKAGDEVITSSYSFSASAGSIARLGATPVFADIEPRAFNIDAAGIESRITRKTKAIIPVHLYGQMADMEAIADIASRHGIPVIEDAAQAIGAQQHGRRAGSIGVMGCFSFFPTKNLGGYGDGGMVLTNDTKIADRLRLVRNHGFRTKYYNETLGGNFRLDAIQAAVLRVKLRHLEAWTEGRRRNAELYHSLLGHCDGIQLPREMSGRRHTYNQFVIRASRRDELKSRLTEAGIGTEVYYPIPLHELQCFRYLNYPEGSLQASEKAAKESLALPIYAELPADSIRTVAGTIIEACGR